MKTGLRISLILLACLMLLVGCGSSTKTSYSTHEEAINAFKTGVETGDCKILATVWAGMKESDLKPSWEGVTGTSELEYLGYDQGNFNYYKLSYTLTNKPSGSKLAVNQGDSIVWYVTLEKQETGWMVASISLKPVYADMLSKN